ncbi:MAG TPA: hypothetical protein VIH90_06655 [Candidatus Saccharimonadales bacterium]
MNDLVKIVVYVPENNADSIRQAIGDAGAGVVGDYTFCSYSIKGIGRYIPGQNANPYIGSSGKLESVDEERIEVQCEKSKAKKVIEAIKAAHPYEEVVIDVYQLLNLDYDQ